MKRLLLAALILCGCMTSEQREQIKQLDAELEKTRAELRELGTAQKAVDRYRVEIATLTMEVDRLRTEVTQSELSRGKKGKSPVFLR